MKALLMAILVVLGLSLILGAPGCMYSGPGDPPSGCGTPEYGSTDPGTRVVGVTVTPPSGSGVFEMTVAYEWMYDGPGSIPKATAIVCYYVQPDGESVRVGDIDPTADPSEYILDKAGWIHREKSFTFDVRPDSGPPTPGVYRGEARVEGNDAASAPAPFTVTKDAGDVSTTTLSTTTTSAPQTTTTVLQQSVYRLEMSVTSSTLGYAGHWQIDWAGDITIAADGSVSGELSGIADMHAKNSNADGAVLGTIGFYVPFKARVSGTVETTGSVRSLHIKQTLSTYQVNIQVVDGKPNTDFVSSNDETVKGFVTEALVDQVFPAGTTPYTGPITAGRLQGTATLTPLR